MKEGFLAILKFLFFLLVLPLVMACVLAFQQQILGVPAHQEAWLLWGAVTYVLLHLFLYNFKEAYMFGRSMVAKLFSFLGPSAEMAGALVPIFAVLTICAGLVLNITGFGMYERFVLFALAFAAALHIVGTAQHMYAADAHPLKGHYLMVFGLVLAANLIVLAAVITPLVPEFSFLDFLKDVLHHSSRYYSFIYKALFVAP